MIKIKTGDRYGKLTIIKIGNPYIAPNYKYKLKTWLCRCDCGNEKQILESNLKRGLTLSCGCLQKERTSKANKKYNKYDLTGEYGIGWTSNTNEKFYFDLEDYDKIKNYCWKGSKMDNDKVYITSTSKNVRLSRLVISFKNPEENVADHINGNTYDNRKTNLREATYHQNSMNLGISKNNSSGVTGVRWNKQMNKWTATIMYNRKTIHLGSYFDKEDAIKIRKEAEIKYFGEYRRK